MTLCLPYVFVAGEPFQPNLMFASKLGAYLRSQCQTR